MTGIQPDVYTPQEWQQIMTNARAALHQNPNDHEALAAIADANKALNAGEAAQLPQTGDRSVLGAVGGVARGVADIPEGLYGLARHPIKALGQMTGIANIPQAAHTVFNDPEANWAEKLDATIRATPFNMGYAPERAFIDAMANPETSSFDRARSGTNVASLALLGLGARKPAAKVPLGAEQFGGPPVLSEPTGAPLPTRAPLPEAPTAPTAALNPMPVGDMSLVPKLKGWIGTGPESITPDALAKTQIIGDPTLTPPTSGVTPPKFTNPQPIPEAGVNAVGAPRGLSVEGPPTIPHTPAMDAMSRSLGMFDRPTAQKGVTFGSESPLGGAAKSEVKTLLGQMQRGGKSTPNLAGEGGFLGFHIGPFLAWEIMRRTVRPMIDRVTQSGIGPTQVMEAVRNNPQLAALERALVKAYAAGQAQQVNELSQQLATQLMMQAQQ